MNKAKEVSKIDGKRFLREAFAAEQKLLSVQLELSNTSITHNGIMGEVNEQYLIKVLRKYLPTRYQVDQGIVIDSNGSTSDQIDIIIFDHQYTPTLLDQHAHRYIPAEAVYCIFEAKQTLNKQYLEYAAEKAHSVRTLKRTSVPIPHAGQEKYPAKEPFPIIAGIIATTASWTDGLASKPFADTLASLTDTRTIECGLALSDRSFDTFTGTLSVSATEGSLAIFLFRLLQHLQSLGTVRAVDWNRYAAVFSGSYT
jgi:hypothetical protein